MIYTDRFLNIWFLEAESVLREINNKKNLFWLGLNSISLFPVYACLQQPKLILLNYGFLYLSTNCLNLFSITLCAKNRDAYLNREALL